MPLVRIETRRGLSADVKRKIMEGIHRALVTTFKIPDHDRNQRFTEYAPEDFDVPTGRGEHYCIVEIIVFPGRSLDTKRALYREIVACFDGVGLPREDVFIVLHEQPRENWAFRGGQAACDLDLGFKVEV
jgi:phenylpyruvate tautomerase PptA (4-oxalocrotonate tautomerase family)